ncbi:MAG: hypothetical protein KatS3mg035_1858 [Bacteroidia bacterium]|nr:MAG: hypothetical protein KatS3mg035_1858 [Bacteroidia bacterium]
MSETLFIFFLTILGIHFLFFIYQPQWKYLLIVVLFSLLACYTRASMLPFLLWIGLAIGFLNRSFIKTFVFFLIVFIGIFPWIYRNYSYTGQWFFTSASQITTYYGRIGGTVLALDKNMNQDAYLKVSADEYLSHRYALHSIKKYHQEIINEENEQIQVPFMEIYLNQQWSMPFHAIIFQLRCIYQQMTGLSYGMSQFLYQSQFIAIFMAILQAIFMVWIYGSFIYLSGRTPEKRLMLLWSASIIFWLLIHNAAWADGRYRYVTDLWSILGIIVLNRKTS